MHTDFRRSDELGVASHGLSAIASATAEDTGSTEMLTQDSNVPTLANVHHLTHRLCHPACPLGEELRGLLINQREAFRQSNN